MNVSASYAFRAISWSRHGVFDLFDHDAYGASARFWTYRPKWCQWKPKTNDLELTESPSSLVAPVWSLPRLHYHALLEKGSNGRNKSYVIDDLLKQCLHQGVPMWSMVKVMNERFVQDSTVDQHCDYAFHGREREILNSISGCTAPDDENITESSLDHISGHVSQLFTLGSFNSLFYIDLDWWLQLLSACPDDAGFCTCGRGMVSIFAISSMLINIRHFIQSVRPIIWVCRACSWIGMTACFSRTTVHYLHEGRTVGTGCLFAVTSSRNRTHGVRSRWSSSLVGISHSSAKVDWCKLLCRRNTVSCEYWQGFFRLWNQCKTMEVHKTAGKARG